MVRTLNYEDYIIARVANLSVEAEAALAVLDEHHKGHFEGTDNYTALDLPRLTQATPRFLNIWLALLVRVAAGLPNLVPNPSATFRYIRLGDVLVCIPDRSEVGIVQYDLGKDTNEGFSINSRQAVSCSS
ncbi:hypothetical protein BBP40_008787 [Aspergillus hancockii]|nr:hypothetical protein BBP40_008787 [Aspergillus hancockii]